MSSLGMYGRFFAKFFTGLVLTTQLSACFVEGGGCSGSFCLSAGADFSANFGADFVDDNCTFDCDQRFRCPDADVIRSIATQEINSARQAPAFSNCAIVPNLSVTPLAWNEAIFSAADRQARDMSANNFVNTLGSDGVDIASRVNAIDATFSDVSQLVAGGFSNTRALIDAYLSNRIDCGELLSAEINTFAMACRYDSDSDFGTYWSLVLANGVASK